MAKIQLSPIITDVRGTLGSKLTFQRRGDGHYVVKKPHPTDKQSTLQLEQRTKFLDARDAWQALSPEDKAQWNEDARVGTNMTGYALYLQAHMSGQIGSNVDEFTAFLLESVNQADGATEFVDAGVHGYGFQTVGNPQHSLAVGSPAGMGTSAINLRTGVLLTDSSFVDVWRDDFTLEMWLYLSSGSTEVLVAQGSSTDVNQPFFVRTGFAFQAEFGAWYTVGTHIWNEWHHICLEHTNGRFYGYINGARMMDRSYPTRNYNNVGQLVIGDGAGKIRVDYNGYIQQLRISTIGRYGGADFVPPAAFWSA